MFPMSAIHNLARPQGASLIDPTLELFFTASDKTGGPTDIMAGFQYVYTEIFIRKSTQVKPAAKLQSECDPYDSNAEESHTDQQAGGDNTKTEPAQNQNSGGVDQDEPVKKKRGRKPKSYYENIAKQEREQQEKLIEQAQQSINEQENEEEVIERQDEFRGHPLYKLLCTYQTEMQALLVTVRANPEI